MKEHEKRVGLHFIASVEELWQKEIGENESEAKKANVHSEKKGV